ncbi:hypothetical protein J6W20_01500 [bacterium]|nr:hypothetical protein [bacterium]
MEFSIAKLEKEVDLATLSNLFSEQVANYLAVQTNQVNEYKVSDLIKQFNNTKFTALDKEDGKVTISQ